MWRIFNILIIVLNFVVFVSRLIAFGQNKNFRDLIISIYALTVTLFCRTNEIRERKNV
jgi:hypothetical protein